ncbi:MAG: hydantoinase/oxoprolinase family protein [Methylophilaceae bacterium]|nr:hydantoinase/oxoprolinase family protein [Methylophilaceae bacterium]MDG1445096.1 hydantoinase/oxoprolinase family protein [Methylophilaceae bacterium]
MHKTLGWDIGGAHVKAVLLDRDGAVLKVQQQACPLWMGLDKLEVAILSVLAHFDVVASQVRHAVTMTGELVDWFANRHEGVVAIADFVAPLLGGHVLFYCMNEDADLAHFVALTDVAGQTKMIASANWHASACLLAQSVPHALVVDVGSTTTDLIVIEHGKVMNRALSDAARMQQNTLVYTGVVRTPVMAVAQRIPFEKTMTNVVAEYFATMADVYRLTTELPESADLSATADGQPKILLDSARRLARMVGYDCEAQPLEVWQRLAYCFREKQCQQIQRAISQYLKGDMIMVGAGVGDFVVQTIAHGLHQPYVKFNTLFNHHDDDLAVCLPAYAVAALAVQKGVF